jgi:hypothetical protein
MMFQIKGTTLYCQPKSPSVSLSYYIYRLLTLKEKLFGADHESASCILLSTEYSKTIRENPVLLDHMPVLNSGPCERI